MKCVEAAWTSTTGSLAHTSSRSDKLYSALGERDTNLEHCLLIWRFRVAQYVVIMTLEALELLPFPQTEKQHQCQRLHERDRQRETKNVVRAGIGESSC